MNTGFLEYGALGLLAGVLIFVGYLFRDYIKGASERERVRDANREASAAREESRRQEQLKFMESLVADAEEERQAHIAAWRAMVVQDLETRLVVDHSLNTLCETVDRYHKEVMSALKGEQGAEVDG